MNNRVKTSLVDFIFKRIAIFVFAPVFLLSIGITYFIYSAVLDKIFTPIDQVLASMHQTSNQIEDTLDNIRPQINDMVASPGMLDNHRLLHNFFYNITNTLPYIYGSGYAFIPTHRHFGEYLHLTNGDKIETEFMSEVYATHNTDYYYRPWFTRAIASGKPVTIQTNQNIFGAPISLVTYSFPIIKNGKPLLVCVLDVPITAFEGALTRLKKISKDSFRSISIFYVSVPPDDTANASFFNIFDANQPLNDIHLTSQLQNIVSNKGSNAWRSSTPYLYKKFSYLWGGATFIIRFDITGVVALTILWLTATLLAQYFIAKYLRKNLVTKLAFVTNPVAQLSNNAQNLALLHLDLPYKDIPKLTHIAEVDHLICSLEQMRYNLKRLIEKEKKLEKTHAELELASRIQHKFIRPSYSNHSKYNQTKLTIEARLQAANLLSGDIYDCITSEDAVYCFIGDATGKEITAAIFASFVLANFKILCDQQLNSNIILNKLNDYLCSMDGEDMFISAVCLKIDFIKNVLEFSVAGHYFPILHDYANQFVSYAQAAPDLVLGVLNDYQYQNYSIPLEQCQHIFLFTDGVSEAMDDDHHALGVNRLIELIENSLKNNNLENNLCQSILKICHQYEIEHSSDDKTVISIRLSFSET
jgi:sigma-B regulation protein RsbU (phosphoserine phosphatase)